MKESERKVIMDNIANSNFWLGCDTMPEKDESPFYPFAAGLVNAVDTAREEKVHAETVATEFLRLFVERIENNIINRIQSSINV